jgi:hypothetical protein
MKRTILLAAMAAVFLGGEVLAQTEVVLDHVTNTQDDSLLLGGQVNSFKLRYRNLSGINYNINNGYRLFSPDGAEWSYPLRDTVIDTILPDPLLTDTSIDSTLVSDRSLFNFFNVTLIRTYHSPDGAGGDTLGFAGAANSLFLGLRGSYDSVAFEIPILSRLQDHRKHICIDSSWFPPGGTWKWAPIDITKPQIAPDWSGQQCFKVFDPNAPQGDLLVDPDTLVFGAIQGGSNPDPQTFEVTASEGTIAFSLTEDVPWLLKSPTSGNTPDTITVSVNITGLTEGSYFDSIEVASNDAANSPQFLYVSLEIGPPPPEIAVSQPAFFFNAIAGGSNPTPQILTITNAGGAPLNWTVAHNETWLSLSPELGVDSGDVTLSVDITGLAFDDYFDTVYVTDPNATNSPVKIPVKLSVASDLPIIDVDYKSLYVVTFSEFEVFERSFYVKNVAGGTMNFTAEESSTRITGLDVHSGVADDSVTVTYRIKSASDGQEFLDTVWIYSNEAINSPVPVPMRIRVVSDPAVLSLSKDSVYLNAYECWPGINGVIPVDEFYVENIGGDNPVEVYFNFDSEDFNLAYDNTLLPQPFTVQATWPTVKPQGTYIGYIEVAADKAINSPETLVVVYTVMPATQTPELLLERDSDSAIYKIGQPSFDMPPYTILNRYGGCLDWFVDAEASWLTPLDSAGGIPDTIAYSITPFGLDIGIYEDSLVYYAPDAGNSPQSLRVKLFVYERRGDVNGDGLIDIGDVTDIIKYLYLSGPAPFPLMAIGDVNCDNLVDIADLTDLIRYLYLGGDEPCDDLIEFMTMSGRAGLDESTATP